MINIRNCKSFCCEDYKTIENYEQAIVDDKTWTLHHKLEMFFTSTELKKLGRYSQVPARELIFLKRKDHDTAFLHKGRREANYNKIGNKFSIGNKSNLGKTFSQEHKQKLSEAAKKRWSKL